MTYEKQYNIKKEQTMYLKKGQQTWINMRISTLVILLLFGCAAKKPFWGNAETGLILSYQIKPNHVWKYKTSVKENQRLSMSGQSLETEMDIVLHYSVKGTAIDQQKNFITQVTIDTMGWTTVGMQGKQNMDVASLVGKSFGLTFSPLGKTLIFFGTDSLPKINLGMMGGIRSIESLFQSPFPILSQTPLKIGDTWTTQDEIKTPSNAMEITIATKSTHTLEGLETLNGMECAKIATHTSGTLDGTGEQMGAKMVLEGDIKNSSVWYFAYKRGVYVQASSEALMEGTIAITGPTDMVIPLTQETKAQITLIQP